VAVVAAVGAEWGDALMAVKNFTFALEQLAAVQQGELAADPSSALQSGAAVQKHFSVDEGVAKYRDIYDQING
jgi:hypothetical protein